MKPYGLTQYDKKSGENPKFPLTGGLDVKYGPRSNLVANLTANTDFADTDVDQRQFNLTPFKIFIPEKRRFFLENAGVFNFNLGDPVPQQSSPFPHRRPGTGFDCRKEISQWTWRACKGTIPSHDS